MEKVPDAGTGSYTAIFVPNDKYEGGYETFTVQVAVTVNKIQVEVPLLDDRIYDGNTAAAEISGTARYRVKKNDKVKNAGTYTVELELTDPTNYVWKKSTSDKVEIQGAVAMISYQILPASIIVNVEKATVENILYGQKLTQNAADKTATVNGVENILTEVTAKGRVNGYSVAYAESSGTPSGTGTWSWVTSQGNDGKEQLTVMSAGGETTVAQPLAAGTYQVKARFTPVDGNLNVYETYLPVTVNKSVPYVPGDLTTEEFFLHEGGNYVVGNIEIKDKNQPLHNKYTGEEVTGTWEWDDGEVTSYEREGTFGVTFKLNDTANYIEPGKNCKMLTRNYAYVTIHLIVDDNLIVKEGDAGKSEKYGLLEGKEWTFKKKMQNNPGTVNFTINSWKNATDADGNVVESSTLKIKNVEGIAVITGWNYTQGFDLTSVKPSVQRSGDSYTIRLQFGLVYGDPDIRVTLTNKGGTSGQSAVQPQKAIKANKNEQKKQDEDVSTANTVQIPEAITPTPDVSQPETVTPTPEPAAPEEPTPTPEPPTPEEPTPEPEPTVPEESIPEPEPTVPEEPEASLPAPEQPEPNAEQAEETAEQCAEENQTVQESSGT